MGWGHGIDGNGRDIGYGVSAVCDFPHCMVEIDRGLAYRCGPLGTETDESKLGCGGYFCSGHLFMPWVPYEHTEVGDTQFCPACSDEIAIRFPEPEDDFV